MPTFAHPLPSLGPDDVTLALARQVGVLLGPAFAAPWSNTVKSLMGADLLAYGSALKGGRETNYDALRNAFVNTAKELLGELEIVYGLAYDPSLSDDARRTRLLVKARAQFAGTPPNIITALTPYDLGQPVTIRETTAAEALSVEAVFRFTVYVKPDVVPSSGASFDSLFVAARLAAIRATVEQMKPAHSSYQLTTTDPSIGFFTDDPDSLTNNTVL
jgi:hypothetical protein